MTTISAMQPYDEGGWGQLYCGDARDVLRTLEEASVDAVCTDPPYALCDRKDGERGFMGSKWDNGKVAHDPAFWAEVLRVAKPGAFLVAFGGTRTYHRLVCAIEDAGWECRDMIAWVQAQGFPKSHSCLKPAIEPIVLAKAPGPLQPLQIDACRVPTAGERFERPATYSGEHPGWDRPWKHEAKALADKQARKDAAAQAAERQGRWPPNLVLSHVPPGPDGTGGCQPAAVRRVRGNGAHQRHNATSASSMWGAHKGGGLGDATTGGYGDADGYEEVQAWSCVPQCPIRLLDEQAGPRTSKWGRQITAPRSEQSMFASTSHGARYNDFVGDTGSASRYFPTFAPDPADAVPFHYCSKASRRDRGDGNTHPTCKSTALLAWLIKLVSKPGDTILDCFAGSGSTAVACIRENRRCIAIEQEPDYVAIARHRIAAEQPALPLALAGE